MITKSVFIYYNIHVVIFDLTLLPYAIYEKRQTMEERRSFFNKNRKSQKSQSQNQAMQSLSYIDTHLMIKHFGQVELLNFRHFEPNVVGITLSVLFLLIFLCNSIRTT